MFKSLVAILVFVTCVFSTTLTTKYRTDLDISTGKTTVIEYASTFEIMDGRFVHNAPGITSVYVVINTVNDICIGGTKLTSVPVRSEAGNEYLYIFDVLHGKVYAIFPNGTRLVQYDLVQ